MNIFDLIIVQPVFNLLLTIYSIIGDFGLAIIVFTILVKFAMWPLMKKQLHQAKLMRKIQPELVEIKKNCKGNRQMESLQMMDLYKKNNIKPFRSLLTLIIQLPLYIALYNIVRMALTDGESVAKFAYAPIKGFGRVNDIINNFDSFQPKLFGLVDLKATALPILGWSSAIILLIAVGSALTQYTISKQQMPAKKSKKKFKDIMKEAAGGKEADQSEINSIVSGQMMKIMPIMMLFIMIQLPGALVLYYAVTNLITIAQQKKVFARDESEMEQIADKKILKELRDIEEGEVVQIKPKKDKTNVTRIKASDNKRRKK
ncbi:MAG: YidC/Oxa1 family membrane protein insertase [Candidatus Nomurabacteria bacterium]|jgi:YidC/Oxa1 family membrane protein insertase|nr:YidC/Oxa1 family membrane protein insertase [Candidatus Nomurabacteria bacterium]